MYCYSCMSRRLQDSWEGWLWQFFRRPEHFTESCDPDHFRRGIVKMRNCTDHCIWLITETQVFGKLWDSCPLLNLQSPEVTLWPENHIAIDALLKIRVMKTNHQLFSLSGQKIPVYTRGCMSDVLNYRQDAVRKLRQGDFCVRRQLSELYNDGDRKFPVNEIVTLCACHANYCNGAGGGGKLDTRWIIVILILQLLIASGFWRCIWQSMACWTWHGAYK